MSNWIETVGQTLHRPLFGTRVIAQDARADVSRLSEDEFPIWCPKCDYLLRGLPDGRCPECGTEFERGRLLVQQYVHQWSETLRRRTTSGKWAVRTAWVGLTVIAVGYLGIIIMAQFGYPILSNGRPTPGASELYHRVLVIWSNGTRLAGIGTLLGLLICLTIAMRNIRRALCTRAKVMDAVPANSDHV